MDWNCMVTEERLGDVLDGALLPEEQAAFSAHTAGCASCVGMVARVGELVSQMREIALVEEPPQLARKILAATLGARARLQDLRWWIAWVPSIWQPQFAMGLATVAASLAIVLHAAGVTPGQISKIDYRPASLVRAGDRQAHLSYARCVKFVNDLRVVYEIEARFASSPAPAAQPAPAPAAQPQPGEEPQSPDSEPRGKSQTLPHPGRREFPRGRELAVLTRFSNSTPRSLL